MSFFDDFSKNVSYSAGKVCEKAEKLAKVSAVTIEIASQKDKLSKIYAKIGERVVENALESCEHENDVFYKLIDEAKCERGKLLDLIKKKEEIQKIKKCRNCGEKLCGDVLYCPSCGAKVSE